MNQVFDILLRILIPETGKIHLHWEDYSSLMASQNGAFGIHIVLSRNNTVQVKQ